MDPRRRRPEEALARIRLGGRAGRERTRARARPAGRPAPTDVLGAHFLPGVAFLVAGAVAGAAQAVAGFAHGRWLALHLALVGGVSQLVLGASLLFAGAFLATEPPGRGALRLQLGSWNAGALLLAVAVPAGSAPASGVAAALLLAGLASYGRSLRSLERRSLQRAPWATRWYYAATAYVVAGVLAGAALASDVAWGGRLLPAHLALNLAGWLGTTIVGTLHTFYPSLTGTVLRRPGLQAPTFASWVVGCAALTAGVAGDLPALALCGWSLLFVAALLLGVNVASSTKAAGKPVALPAQLVGIAQALLVAGVAAALVTALAAGAAAPLVGSERGPTAVLLLAGWIGLTVLGSLLHLLGVLLRARGRPPRDGAGPLDRALSAFAGAAVAGAALASAASLDAPLEPALVAALGLAYALVGARVLARAAAVLRDAPPRV
jgi:nitrite reductase (NO-forming)